MAGWKNSRMDKLRTRQISQLTKQKLLERIFEKTEFWCFTNMKIHMTYLNCKILARKHCEHKLSFWFRTGSRWLHHQLYHKMYFYLLFMSRKTARVKHVQIWNVHNAQNQSHSAIRQKQKWWRQANFILQLQLTNDGFSGPHYLSSPISNSRTLRTNARTFHSKNWTIKFAAFINEFEFRKKFIEEAGKWT